jgi:hypothetical protein
VLIEVAQKPLREATLELVGPGAEGGRKRSSDAWRWR